ncbi:MAG: hypothetical protein Q4G03_10300 [Planctomycetia bacterium]|nr:hypothetical protein [Planctomycetia bacterium]
MDDDVRELVATKEINLDTILEPPMGDRRTVAEVFPDLLKRKVEATPSETLDASQTSSTSASSPRALASKTEKLAPTSFLETTSLIEESSQIETELLSLSKSTFDDFDRQIEENRPDTTNLAVAKSSVKPTVPSTITPTDATSNAPDAANVTPEPALKTTPNVATSPRDAEHVSTLPPLDSFATYYRQESSQVKVESRSTQTSHEQEKAATKTVDDTPKTTISNAQPATRQTQENAFYHAPKPADVAPQRKPTSSTVESKKATHTTQSVHKENAETPQEALSPKLTELIAQLEQSRNSAPKQEKKGCAGIIACMIASVVFSGILSAFLDLDANAFFPIVFFTFIVFCIGMSRSNSSKNKRNQTPPRR